MMDKKWAVGSPQLAVHSWQLAVRSPE